MLLALLHQASVTSAHLSSKLVWMPTGASCTGWYTFGNVNFLAVAVCKALEIQPVARHASLRPNSPQSASTDKRTRLALSFCGVLGFLRRAARYEPPDKIKS